MVNYVIRIIESGSRILLTKLSLRFWLKRKKRGNLELITLDRSNAFSNQVSSHLLDLKAPCHVLQSMLIFATSKCCPQYPCATWSASLPSNYCNKIVLKWERSQRTKIGSQTYAVIMVQLAERMLLIPEDPGSNPIIGNFYWTYIYC